MWSSDTAKFGSFLRQRMSASELPKGVNVNVTKLMRAMAIKGITFFGFAECDGEGLIFTLVFAKRRISHFHYCFCEMFHHIIVYLRHGRDGSD